MSCMNTLIGRGGRIAGFMLALAVCLTVALVCPRGAAAQDVESMLPEQLVKEVHKAQAEYHKVMEEVHAAENERLARKAAGATDAALAEADAELARALHKAEQLKVQADYLEELYETKRREYKTR